MEILNDEEAFIRIEALDIITDLLEYLTMNQIENEYLPVVLNTIDVNIEEII